jgi:hypothetical protein
MRNLGFKYQMVLLLLSDFLYLWNIAFLYVTFMLIMVQISYLERMVHYPNFFKCE